MRLCSQFVKEGWRIPDKPRRRNVDRLDVSCRSAPFRLPVATVAAYNDCALRQADAQHILLTTAFEVGWGDITVHEDLAGLWSSDHIGWHATIGITNPKIIRLKTCIPLIGNDAS